MSTDNQIDTDLAREFFEADDGFQEELLDLQMTYMRDCREIREKQKASFKSGVEAGLPKDGFRLELKLHRMKNTHARQLQNALDDEEDDTRESAEAIRNALGDYGSLPLGIAAVEKAEGEKAGKAAAPKRGRGRPKKATTTPAPTSGKSTLDELNDGAAADVRPRFMQDADAARVAENSARIEEGISELKH